MTDRVDFYVLNSGAPAQRFLLACRLAERAYLSGRKVVILQSDSNDARVVDDLLWTFNERSFVPHDLCLDEKFDPATPVHIGLHDGTLPHGDLLVNLSDRPPPSPERFACIAEIIDADPERRRLGRERFKSYRDLKMPLETLQLDDAADI